MHLSRRNPRLRSFKNVVVATFAIFVLTNFADSPFTRVFAPSAEAAAVAAAAAADYIPADVPTSGDHNLDLIIMRAGEREGVDPRLVHAVIWQESKYKNEAVSHVGAQGLMQLMPATAKRFGGDGTLALAGYNGGEGNVDKYEGVPPFGETQNYVRVITGRYGKTYHPVLAPEEAAAYFKLLPSQAQELAAN